MARSKEGTSFESLPAVQLNAVNYEYLSIQRGGLSAIYRGPDTFLRIGDAEKIQKDLETHKKMEANGFPIPKLISEGTYEGKSYFIEDSLGPDHFGVIFKKEVEATGKISEETFETFTKISERWAAAQLEVAEQVKDWSSFERGIHLDLLCKEMPEEKDKILATYNKAKEALVVFPFTPTHGDFGPFNMYPKGVIDLESSFSGPAPYDVGSLITHLEWFPESKDYEYFQFYNFTPEQKQKYLARIDDVYAQHNLPKVSDHLFELDFLKGVWFAVGLESVPKLQKFRYDRIRKLINTV